jgi:glycosyltransferase involved in cell wall biosynthesis
MTKLLPVISILMPVKNAAPFLPDCLRSIIHQSFTDWELVAVNDHSTDESCSILENFARQDARIVVYSNQGQGIIPALQLSYSKSRGEYITRMDADDIMDERKMESLIMELRQRGRGHLAVGLVSYFSNQSLGEGYTKYAEWLNEISLSGDNFSNNHMYQECTIPSPCWMCHREDLKLSGAFDSTIYPEDYDLAFRFRKAKLIIATVNKQIHQWRDHPKRSSRTDVNYQDNQFVKLKVHHFIDQDYDKTLPLILWGAGKKGKKIARELITYNIDFKWVSNNEKKIGQAIYSSEIASQELLSKIAIAQVIIAISSPADATEINKAKDDLSRHAYFSFS